MTGIGSAASEMLAEDQHLAPTNESAFLIVVLVRQKRTTSFLQPPPKYCFPSRSYVIGPLFILPMARCQSVTLFTPKQFRFATHAPEYIRAHRISSGEYLTIGLSLSLGSNSIETYPL
jgi:hypothetical protein